MTKIEWTDRTWNPVTGCNKVSQGCKNCYAEVMHRRQMAMNPHKYTRPFLDGAELHPEVLNDPQHWKKPCMIFVNSMSDLFHPGVPSSFIDSVFISIAKAPWHTYQILTKRPERMLEYFSHQDRKRFLDYPVWLGVSCENQAAANERIPLLLQIPAAVRFLSCEPLLGPIDLCESIRYSQHPNEVHTTYFGDKIHWVITGGESGHHARAVHPDWVRSLRDQCQAGQVPFFFKQWGEWVPVEEDPQPPFVRFLHDHIIRDSHHVDFLDPVNAPEPGKFQGKPFMDCIDALNVCRAAKSLPVNFWKAGKKIAGNLLDGIKHENFPTLPTV